MIRAPAPGGNGYAVPHDLNPKPADVELKPLGRQTCKHPPAQIVDEQGIVSRNCGRERIEDPARVESPGRGLRNRFASPLWGWSGVGEIDSGTSSEAALRRVVARLPSRKSTVETVVAELRDLGGRYHRNLRQDEFGPVRAERMQALRDLIDALSALLSKLETLPAELRLLMTEDRFEAQASSASSSFDLYVADKAAIERVFEIAVDVRQMLADSGHTREAALMEETSSTVERLLALLGTLDTTTETDAELASDASGYAPPGCFPTSNFKLLAPIARLHSRFGNLLARLEAAKGPETAVSLTALVAELAEVWLRETGRPVRANPAHRGVYDGRPRSESGRFMVAAVEALQPTAAWFKQNERLGLPPARAAVVLGSPGYREQAVHAAMRRLAAARALDPLAPQRGRPRGA